MWFDHVTEPILLYASNVWGASLLKRVIWTLKNKILYDDKLRWYHESFVWNCCIFNRVFILYSAFCPLYIRFFLAADILSFIANINPRYNPVWFLRFQKLTIRCNLGINQFATFVNTTTLVLPILRSHQKSKIINIHIK